jgi:hypothetical protein
MNKSLQIARLGHGAVLRGRPYVIHHTTRTIRFASSTAVSSRNSREPIPNSRINPPPTARPPPIDFPTREKDENHVKYIYRLGKAYLAFYKTSTWGVWTNGKITRKAMAAARKYRPDPHHVGPPTGFTIVNEGKAGEVKVPIRSRAEFQLMWRQMHDGKRLPLLGIMLGVFFEFLPVVMTVFRRQLTPVLPYPCRLPEQVMIGRMNRLKWQQRAERRLNGRNPSELTPDEYIVYSAEFHGLKLPIIPFAMHPLFYHFRSVRKYYDYLRWDDILIHRDGGVKEMIDEEVIFATLDRGIWDPEASIKELRRRLMRNVDSTFKQEEPWLKELEREAEIERLRDLERERAVQQQKDAWDQRAKEAKARNGPPKDPIQEPVAGSEAKQPLIHPA